jgi:hypothetical protein
VERCGRPLTRRGGKIGVVPARYSRRERTMVRTYRGLVELAEHELETLPDPDGLGRSARQGVAMRVLQIVTQTRELPTVSGLAVDGDGQELLKPYEHRLALSEQRAREVLAEGPGGLGGVREPRRPLPSSGSSGQRLEAPM